MNLIKLTEFYKDELEAFGLHGKVIKKGATFYIHFPCGKSTFSVSFRYMDDALIMTVSNNGQIRNFCITDEETETVARYIKEAASEIC